MHLARPMSATWRRVVAKRYSPHLSHLTGRCVPELKTTPERGHVADFVVSLCRNQRIFVTPVTVSPAAADRLHTIFAPKTRYPARPILFTHVYLGALRLGIARGRALSYARRLRGCFVSLEIQDGFYFRNKYFGFYRCVDIVVKIFHLRTGSVTDRLFVHDGQPWNVRQTWFGF